MSVTFDPHWRYCDLRLLRLENDWLALDILPELGAKIYSLVHKPSGKNLLWHNPRLLPERAAYGAAFDDHWAGGWDEILPNDLPVPTPGGELLPDHGEFWAGPADWRIVTLTERCCELRFNLRGRVLPADLEKTVLLTADDPFARIRYRFSNSGSQAFPFLWNIHPALAVSEASWIDVPAGRGLTDAWHADQFTAGSAFEWPLHRDCGGNPVDLRRVLSPSAGTADMHYLVDVADGWYAVTDQSAQVGFGLRFPVEVFPHVWLFRTFGGWRGLHTLILEPSSGYPFDLAAAAQAGACAVMPPHGMVEAEVLAVPFAGMGSVRELRPDGQVVPGR